MSKILANQIANYGDDAPIEIKEGLNIPAGKPIQAAGITGTSGQVLSTTGVSIAWVDPFNGDYNNLTNTPAIPAAQVNSDWDASSGLAVILNKPAVPPLPSVTTVAASSGGALAYNSGNGQFTFTPASISPNWDTAYGWGNHASAGYLTSLSDAAGVTAAKITNWDAAYSWGNHASAGYLTSYLESDTLDTVLTRGATTTQDITTTGKVYFSNNFATTGDLPNATTYHGMFAHVHAENHGYFAHAGAWTQLLDTGSSINELADVNLATAPQSGQVLAYDGSNWVATAAGGGGGGIALTDISVSTASTGTAALSYNNVSGVFTYTPPDLSSYAQTANLTIANWDGAYGWGNHASAGYLVATAQDKTNWNLAYGWGDHGSAGYLTTYSETGTLADVTGRGATTSSNLTLGGTVQFNNNSAFANDKVLNFGGSSNGRILYVSATNSFDVRVPGGSEDLKLGAGTAVRITNENGLTDRAVFTASGATIVGTLTAGGLTYPTTNGTNGDVLTSDGAGNVTWAAPTGGGGGANVTISDTIPAGTPAAGDLWWESDSGRLKVYYTDVDSSQWIDASPPLTQDRIATSSAPSSATDTGTPGGIRYDSSYVYICISNNTWKRAALTTW